MTPCEGRNQPPGWTYESVRWRRLHNGRWHMDPGTGRCAVCDGVHSIRKARGSSFGVMYYHHDLRTCTNESKRMNANRRRFQEYRNRIRPQVDNVQVVNWADRVHQTVDVVEEVPGQILQTARYGGEYWHTGQRMRSMIDIDPPTTFRVQVSSGTRNTPAMNWIFNINGQNMAFPTREITLATNALIWDQWSQSITTGATATSRMQVWDHWASIRTANTITATGQQAYYYPPLETPQQRQEREEERFRQVEVRRRAQHDAVARARSTLEELLSALAPDQIAAYRDRREFRVRGSNGTLFRIRHGYSGNVDYIDESGNVLGTLCAHPNMIDHNGLVLPHEDAMIAQLLHLTSDEDDWLRRANLQRGRRPELIRV